MDVLLLTLLGTTALGLRLYKLAIGIALLGLVWLLRV